MIKGKPTSFTNIYNDPDVNNNPTFTSDSSSVELTVSFNNDLSNGICKYMFDVILTSSQNIKVFLHGECGGTGYKATTWYDHWDIQSRGGSTQNNASGGYFLRGHGTHIYFSGEFRNFGDRLVNFGKAYAINESGEYIEFVIQKLNKNSDQTKLLGLSMPWLFENETAGNNVPLDSSSYFYIEKVQTI